MDTEIIQSYTVRRARSGGAIAYTVRLVSNLGYSYIMDGSWFDFTVADRAGRDMIGHPPPYPCGYGPDHSDECG